VGKATFSSFAVFQANASACWAAAPLEAMSIRGPRRREAIASIAPLAGLRELSIENSRMDGREVGQFADAPLLSTLRTLNISNCHLGTEGFRRLVASAHLRNVTALRTPLNFIGNGGVSALFDAVALDSL